jgi:hypothetical protein
MLSAVNAGRFPIGEVEVRGASMGDGGDSRSVHDALPWGSPGRADVICVDVDDGANDLNGRVGSPSKVEKVERTHGSVESTIKVERTPLPFAKIMTLWVLLFADAAVSTAPFPFLPFMVSR